MAELVTVLSEIFPTSVRYTGSALTFTWLVFLVHHLRHSSQQNLRLAMVYMLGYYLTAAITLSPVASC